MDGGGLEVRDASVADAAACAAVYAPYVTGTAISFEAEPPSEQELARRIEAAQAAACTSRCWSAWRRAGTAPSPRA